MFKSLITNEDEFYIKIFSNSQELTTSSSLSNSMIMDSKLISDVGFKDSQLIYMNILNRSNLINNNNNSKLIKQQQQHQQQQLVVVDKSCVPMIILSNEINFNNLFDLLNLISSIEFNNDNNKKRTEFLSTRIWEVMMLLPTNQTYLKLISYKLESHLSKLADQFLLNNLTTTTNSSSSSPYKLLYYLQIIEIVSQQQQQQQNEQDDLNSLSTTWPLSLYRLLVTILKNIINLTTCLNSIILLECLLITIRLLSNSLILSQSNNNEENTLINDNHDDDEETPKKKLKRSSPSLSSQQQQQEQEQNYSIKSLIKWSLFKNLIKTQHEIDMFLSLLFDIQIYVASFNTDESINEIRLELISYTMQFIAICLIGCNDVKLNESEQDYSIIKMLKETFFNENLKQIRLNWLKSLFLIETSTKRTSLQLRKEASNWIYKICILEQQQQQNSKSSLLNLILNELLSMLDVPVKYRPATTSVDSKLTNFKYNFKDYFILTSNLIRQNNSNNTIIDSNQLMLYIAKELNERDCYEYIQNGVCHEDDVLIGLLSLALSILKQQSINNKKQAQNKPNLTFISDLFDYLFKITCHNQQKQKATAPPQQPKTRSVHSRTLSFDLLLELCRFNSDIYEYLNKKLISLHKTLTITLNNNNNNNNQSNSSGKHYLDLINQSYSWDYWPRDDARSSCGYVGLINLGATCYMATSMQQLFMISEARECILRSNVVKSSSSNDQNKTHSYDKMLTELKRMFAYLQESERKAYNPKDFCKVYIMDQQPLNTAEQKDMQEFFTDLISKLEETSNPELKNLIKNLFGGTITNLVISLDCPHVSCTLEEFYTVRCQVAGMKDLYDSLNEITVKDTLEGDNMYTCSKCARKVRAEKRACFRQLPQILCFNTMRYTFNMITMLKEKVNTHFSFPLQLNMSGYMEKNLKPSLPNNQSMNGSPLNEQIETNDNNDIISSSSDNSSSSSSSINSNEEDYIYELIGVTVHTGTAEGGHYYSFIRERNQNQENCSNNNNNDGLDENSIETNTTSNTSGNSSSSTKAKWYLFNDAEVKPFDAVSQLASECFGGETTSKTYDSNSDKFMDLSFEKTNSAYMLFYERTNRIKSSFKMDTSNKNE